MGLNIIKLIRNTIIIHEDFALPMRMNLRRFPHRWQNHIGPDADIRTNRPGGGGDSQAWSKCSPRRLYVTCLNEVQSRNFTSQAIYEEVCDRNMSLKDLSSTKQHHVKLQLGINACIQSKHLKISKLNETVFIDQNGHMLPGKVKAVPFRRKFQILFIKILLYTTAGLFRNLVFLLMHSLSTKVELA